LPSRRVVDQDCFQGKLARCPRSGFLFSGAVTLSDILKRFARPFPQTLSDPELFVLHPHPVELNYNEFERLLLGIAWHVYITKKKGEAFEEYLGEMLDTIFKKAGILIEVKKDKADADE